MTYELLTKSTYLNHLRALPRQERPKIEETTWELAENPLPDGATKIKLEMWKGKPPLYRIRQGNYRVIYTFNSDHVELIAVGTRKDIYERFLKIEPITDLHGGEIEIPAQEGGQAKSPVPPAEEYLPTRIDRDLLNRLYVAEPLHDTLLPCRTVDDLCNADVPDNIRERVFEAVMATDIGQTLAKPTYITGGAANLLKYVGGELIGFLLKLDQEQEALVDWGRKGAGPTLVKGGPGTGKSTIALYRVRAILRDLQRRGARKPRILFTTYTNSLVSFSVQLLESLLGEDAKYVQVRTADSVVQEVVQSLGLRQRVVHDRELAALLHKAAAGTGELAVDGSGFLREAPELSEDYVLEEIGTVIEARELRTLDEYLDAPRTGRKVRLTVRQRTALWQVYTELVRLLDSRGLTTWHRLRRRAMDILRAGAGPARYDGVVVDEGQDLDPTVLRLLVELNKSPNCLFITADANQSIYGSSFRWSDVHEDLKIRGRTALLRTNHRSTRQIGEAARSYLAAGLLDEESEQGYHSEGPPPTLARAENPAAEVALLAEFMREAACFYRLGLDSSAVLVPSEQAGREIAFALGEMGIPAEFMLGRELDLKKRAVKVITLHSAKGLEFPIVCLAGFGRAHAHSMSGTVEEREERLLRERRTMFVGMTRAMRALCVISPTGLSSPLLDGFDLALWHSENSPGGDAR